MEAIIWDVYRVKCVGDGNRTKISFNQALKANEGRLDSMMKSLIVSLMKFSSNRINFTTNNQS